jgi:GntR family transcriptional regulator
MITVDLRSRVPIYEQIKTQIMELILIGVLKPHDQLPSVRQLARDLSINFNTVKKAFSDLEAEEIIYSLVGRGSFVCDNAVGSDRLRRTAAESIKNAAITGRATGLSRQEIMDIINEIYKAGA